MDTNYERLRMYAVLYHPLPGYDPEEALCGNCEHWDIRAAERMGLTPGRGRPDARPDGRPDGRLAPCAMRAVRLDGAGRGGMILFGPANHCREYDEAFEPSQEFVLELLGRINPAA